MITKPHKDCYCSQCCDAATEWWEWRSVDGADASGSRYWTEDDARLDTVAAKADGLPILTHRKEVA